MALAAKEKHGSLSGESRPQLSCLIDNLQVEALVPNGVELLRHRLGPLLNLAYLDSDVWVGRAALVLCYQPLCAYHCFHAKAINTNQSSSAVVPR